VLIVVSPPQNPIVNADLTAGAMDPDRVA